MIDRPGNVRVRGANVPMNTPEPLPLPPVDYYGVYQQQQEEQQQPTNPYAEASRQQYERLTAESERNRQNPVTRFFADIFNPVPGQPWNWGRPRNLEYVEPRELVRAAEESGAIPQSSLTQPPVEEVIPTQQPAGLTFQEWYGQNAQPFDESPYRNYMNFLATQDEETMARVNAMYNQLAESAAANMERIGDIYGSAQMTSGDVYGGSAQAIEGAYGSAQQQAADQMARLGIEAAAPAVLNPMALSQAEAVAGIEAAGAGALDALTRYGTSAQEFGGQMAQVGQQQGLEVSNQILRDMAQRQAEAVFQMEQARANYNPYSNLMQRMQLENMYNEPMLRAQEGNLEAQQRAAELQLDTTLSRQDKILRIWTDIREDYPSDKEAWQAATAAVQQAEAMYPIF